MTTTTDTITKPGNDDIIVMRKPPKGAHQYTYIVHRDDSSAYQEYENGARVAIRDGLQVELLYSYRHVTIDGATYRRSSLALPSTRFYTLKDDPFNAPDYQVYWDSAFEFKTTCEYCEKPWEMNEKEFLAYGHIRCNHCGVAGQGRNSMWT